MSFAFAGPWPPLIQSVKNTMLRLHSHAGASLLVALVWGLCWSPATQWSCRASLQRGVGSHCTAGIQPGTRDVQNSPESTVVNRGLPPDVGMLWIGLHLGAFGTTSVIQLGGSTWCSNMQPCRISPACSHWARTLLLTDHLEVVVVLGLGIMLFSSQIDNPVVFFGV